MLLRDDQTRSLSKKVPTGTATLYESASYRRHRAEVGLRACQEGWRGLNLQHYDS